LIETRKNNEISVVIPFFRGGKFLAEAIESVLSQTEKDWELILVDNNASDETREVAKRYTKLFPEKIILIHEPKQGLSFARNSGIKEASGTYVALLDDDDMMYPERLSLQKKALNEHPDTILCYGWIDRVSSDNSTILEHAAKDDDFPFFHASIADIDPKICLRFPEPRPSSIMLKKDVAREIGYFDEHFNPFFLEETEFYFRAAQVGSFFEVPAPIIRFRMPSPEFLKTKRINNVFKYRLLLNQDYFYSKIVKFLHKKNIIQNPYVEKDLSKMKARWLREASFLFLPIPDGERFARLLLRRSIREYPTDPKSYKHWIRSFAPLSTRQKRYPSQQAYENTLPPGITEEFLNSLYTGSHACPHCQPENQESDFA